MPLSSDIWKWLMCHMGRWRQYWGWWRRTRSCFAFLQRPSSRLFLLQNFLLLLFFLWVCWAVPHRETEPIWSCSHGAKHGASPSLNKHHKHTRTHTEKHTRPWMSQDVMPCGVNEDAFLSSFIQTEGLKYLTSRQRVTLLKQKNLFYRSALKSFLN